LFRERTVYSDECAGLPVLDVCAAGVRVWSPKEIITFSDSLVNSREMREGLAIGFHAVTFLQYAFAVFYDYTYTIVPHNVTSVHNVYGGKFKFLTFWDAVSIDV